MSKQRRKYDEDFKRRAVQLNYTSEQTIQETADSLGIHVSLLNLDDLRICGHLRQRRACGRHHQCAETTQQTALRSLWSCSATQI